MRTVLSLHRSYLLSTLLLLTAPIAAQSVTYVDARASGKGDGSSWQDAYTDVQSALGATQGGEIWIAQGTYRPAGPNGSRDASFVLRKGVSLIGGFAGTETARIQSDPTAHPTVLSGDLNGDDQSGWVNQTDNVHVVVRAAGLDLATELFGLTIRGGRAIPKTYGAGIQMTSGSLTLRRCTIDKNLSGWAGGIGGYGVQELVLEDCRVTGNRAHLGRGAGIHMDKSGKLVLRRCRFEGNDAVGGGTTQGVGGALYLGFGTSLEATDCVFERNTALYQFGGSHYPSEGGALCSLGGRFVLDRCLFLDNRGTSGGAIYSYEDGDVRNCVFDANRAMRQFDLGGNGGAILVAGTASLTIEACVFYGNRSDEDCAGVWASKAGATTITGSIFWANVDKHGTVSETHLKGGTYSHLCVENMLKPRQGEDPIDPKKFPASTASDPRFVDVDGADNVPATEDDDFRILPVSPCLDAGDPATKLLGLDHGAGLRLLDGDLDGGMRVDIGAHEYAPLQLEIRRVGSSLQVDLLGDARLFAVLVVGAEGPGLLVAPFGELRVDLLQPLLVLPVAPVPTRLLLPLPATPLGIVLQGAGFTAGAGVLTRERALPH